MINQGSNDILREIHAEGYSVTLVQGGALDGIRIMVEDRLTSDRWVARGTDVQDGIRDVLTILEKNGFRSRFMPESFS